MKRLSALVLLAVSGVALADGTPAQYDQAIVNKMSLDPNEAVVNDDGAQEDPNARMSPTARAFRNGYYNGKKAQKDQDESTVNTPPLPRDPVPDNQKWATIPPQPQQQYIQQYRPIQPSYPQPPARYQPQYAEDDPAYAYSNERPVYRPPVTNVYVQPPQYQPQPYPYAEPPPPYYEAPQPVYAPPPGPPQSTYVVVPGVPPTLATGYWPRGYRPVYAQRPYYYRNGW